MLTLEKSNRINKIAYNLNIPSKLKWPAFLIFWVSDYLHFPSIIGFIAFWVFVLGLIASIIRIILVFRKCPYCQQPFALKKACTKEVGSEAISVKTKVKTKNKQGEMTGITEQFIPGTRTFFTKVFVCKYCAQVKHSKTWHKDRANV